jgi:hypothetical protein
VKRNLLILALIGCATLSFAKSNETAEAVHATTTRHSGRDVAEAHEEMAQIVTVLWTDVPDADHDASLSSAQTAASNTC